MTSKVVLCISLLVLWMQEVKPNRVPCESCRDNQPAMCGTATLVGMCNMQSVKLICPLSCRVCRPCPPRCTNNCFDTNHFCAYLVPTHGCNRVGYLCRKSCRLCEQCPVTTTPPPTTTETTTQEIALPCEPDPERCVDDYDVCEYWRKDGYCEAQNRHGDSVRKHCRSTCRICVRCDLVYGTTPSPTLA